MPGVTNETGVGTSGCAAGMDVGKGEAVGTSPRPAGTRVGVGTGARPGENPAGRLNRGVAVGRTEVTCTLLVAVGWIVSADPTVRVGAAPAGGVVAGTDASPVDGPRGVGTPVGSGACTGVAGWCPPGVGLWWNGRGRDVAGADFATLIGRDVA